jgi:hypothetical protein
MKDIDKLRGFARDIMDLWPDGNLEFGDIQEIAVKHGILKEEIIYKECENCSCTQYYDEDDFKNGVVCYRKSDLIK